MEINPEHIASLKGALEKEANLEGIRVEIEQGDFADKLRGALQSHLRTDGSMPPTFVFVDPFNYNLPIEYLKTILQHDRCEVLVTFMAQDVAMAARDFARGSTGKGSILDGLYGDRRWESMLKRPSFEQQLDDSVTTYAQAIGAKWCTTMRMKGHREYALMHFTNSDRGREEMKRAMWDVTKMANKPGEFYLSMADDPANAALLEMEIDYKPFTEQFRQRFAGKTVDRSTLEEWCLRTNYLQTHMNEVIRRGVEAGWITKNFKGQIGPSMGSISVRKDEKDEQEALF